MRACVKQIQFEGFDECYLSFVHKLLCAFTDLSITFCMLFDLHEKCVGVWPFVATKNFNVAVFSEIITVIWIH